MKTRYDKIANALYVYLSDKPYSHGVDLGKQRRIDYSADNEPIGIELLSVSKGINLEGLPEQDKVARLLEKRFKVFV